VATTAESAAMGLNFPRSRLRTLSMGTFGPPDAQELPGTPSRRNPEGCGSDCVVLDGTELTPAAADRAHKPVSCH